MSVEGLKNFGSVSKSVHKKIAGHNFFSALKSYLLKLLNQYFSGISFLETFNYSAFPNEANNMIDREWSMFSVETDMLKCKLSYIIADNVSLIQLFEEYIPNLKCVSKSANVILSYGYLCPFLIANIQGHSLWHCL